jgi:hypothetical protein
VNGETGPQRGGHLDGGAACLGVALGEVGIPGGEQRTGRVHRQEEPGAGHQVLDVDVAALFPGRDGPERFSGDRFGGGDRPRRIGRKHRAAGVERGLLAVPGPAQEIMAGGKADRAHERRARHAHPRKVLRRREPLIDLPADQEGLGEDVCQEPEAWNLGGEAEGLGCDLQDLHLEQVPGLGAGHVDRPCQGVDHAEIDLSHLRRRRTRGELPIQRVAGLEDYLLTRLTLEDGRDAGMPAVVPRLSLIGQGPVAVDPDLTCRHRLIRLSA